MLNFTAGGAKRFSAANLEELGRFLLGYFQKKNELFRQKSQPASKNAEAPQAMHKAIQRTIPTQRKIKNDQPRIDRETGHGQHVRFSVFECLLESA
jgi:hypothetical protein